MMTVFRDVLPGYKIRKLTDAELEVKVTKGVQRTRDYEMTLLKAFQAYLKLLRSIASNAAAPLAHARCDFWRLTSLRGDSTGAFELCARNTGVL